MSIFLLQTIRIAVPYLFAASAGVISERAGIIALTLEGLVLSGAFGSALVAFYTGSAWLGALAGMALTILVALLYGHISIRYRADQVVTGIALNLVVIAATRFFLQLAFDSSSNSPRVPGFGEGGLWTNPLFWLGLLAAPALAWLLTRTVFGLRVQAVGEHPEAAAASGIAVSRVRYLAMAICGLLAGLGGAYLALDQHQFTDNMTAGRGFIALAAVIFGRWKPLPAAVACLLFAAAEALQIQLQGAQLLPTQFVQMIPYVLTIVALAGLVGRSTAPAALGKA